MRPDRHAQGSTCVFTHTHKHTHTHTHTVQGRLFSYADTHRHRLGANYHQIPVNCPYASKARNYQRDGPMTIDSNQGSSNSAYTAHSCTCTHATRMHACVPYTRPRSQAYPIFVLWFVFNITHRGERAQKMGKAWERLSRE